MMTPSAMTADGMPTAMPTLAPGLEFSSSAPELDVGSDAGGALGSVAIASAVGRPEVLLLVAVCLLLNHII